MKLAKLAELRRLLKSRSRGFVQTWFLVCTLSVVLQPGQGVAQQNPDVSSTGVQDSPSERDDLGKLIDQVDQALLKKKDSDPDALFFYTASIGLRASIATWENEWWDAAQLGKKMKRNAEDLVQSNDVVRNSTLSICTYKDWLFDPVYIE